MADIHVYVLQGLALKAWSFSMYSNNRKAKVLAKGFLTNLGATPSNNLPSFSNL